MILKPLSYLALLLALAGCSTDPAPLEQLGLTQQAIEQARAVGADERNAQYQMAVDKAGQAQADMATRAYKAARLAAEQAELDARLAEAQVLTRKSLEQVAQQDARIQRLRKQVKAAQ